MSIISQIKPLVIKALKDLYGQDFSEFELTINTTKPVSLMEIIPLYFSLLSSS